MAGKLLVIRQGVNMAYLLSDSGKRIQVETLALAIASGFLIPPAAAVIEAALIFAGHLRRVFWMSGNFLQEDMYLL